MNRRSHTDGKNRALLLTELQFGHRGTLCLVMRASLSPASACCVSSGNASGEMVTFFEYWHFVCVHLYRPSRPCTSTYCSDQCVCSSLAGRCSPSMFWVTSFTCGHLAQMRDKAWWPGFGCFSTSDMGKCLSQNALYHLTGSRRNACRVPILSTDLDHTASLAPRNVGMPGSRNDEHV